MDLAFVDGMHLAEYALRDVLAIERFTLPTSVVVLDDMLPRTVEMAKRKRTTIASTGDVYKAADALRRLRPDLLVLEADTSPTGTCVGPLRTRGAEACRGLRRVGRDRGRASRPPAGARRRARAHPALDPEVLLASPGWRRLADLRRSARPGSDAEVREAFVDLVSADRAHVGYGAPRPPCEGTQQLHRRAPHERPAMRHRELGLRRFRAPQEHQRSPALHEELTPEGHASAPASSRTEY